MNILLAPDSFKGSLTSVQVASIMKKAIKSVNPNDTVLMKPMADGGEGTVDVLLSSSPNSRRIPISCTGPLGVTIETYYGIIDNNVAVIEVANIAGLVQVPDGKRNPDNTTTYGVGEVILDAINKGCTSIIIGLGGSATNDGGFGLLQALGMEAYDQNGKHCGIFGKDLHSVKRIDVQQLESKLKNVSIKAACDVENILCGVNGATQVYGRQKGASEEQVLKYDESLKRYQELIRSEKAVSKVENAAQIPGSGAAGGLGFALLGLGAKLVSGSELITNILQMEEAIKQSDLVITGEGQSDEQTLFGKAPAYIADLAKLHGVPTLLLSGSVVGNADLLREKFAGCFSIISSPLSLQECIRNADELLFKQTTQITHFVHSILNMKTLYKK
ncbi:glycerate kinase [Virgibacillus halodenitrificans]|uniref:glycerate kinase n=1 Tax=Virgibacillus halodenitrificans TaxID=1482 RepID=UPI002DB72ADA|nr:glycerate kinase [Virgibacillus halodenitrificans]MEC2158333.1 glycerate kinase [Virgibacillus halodenitrificans]